MLTLDWEGETRYARYNWFDIGESEENYRLKVLTYTGDAGEYFISNESHHDKTKKVACAPSEDSDRTVRMLGAHSFCWFCHVATQFILIRKTYEYTS